MQSGDKVKVISYQGTLEPVYPNDENADYWRLIGSTGRIIDDRDAEYEGKVYVRFNQSLNDYKLKSRHENMGLKYRNTLYLMLSDLEIES